MSPTPVGAGNQSVSRLPETTHTGYSVQTTLSSAIQLDHEQDRAQFGSDRSQVLSAVEFNQDQDNAGIVHETETRRSKLENER